MKYTLQLSWDSNCLAKANADISLKHQSSNWNLGGSSGLDWTQWTACRMPIYSLSSAAGKSRYYLISPGRMDKLPIRSWAWQASGWLKENKGTKRTYLVELCCVLLITLSNVTCCNEGRLFHIISMAWIIKLWMCSQARNCTVPYFVADKTPREGKSDNDGWVNPTTGNHLKTAPPFFSWVEAPPLQQRDKIFALVPWEILGSGREVYKIPPPS